MSLLNLILLSATPVAGLGVLLGIDRFEKFVLDERGPQDTPDPGAVEVALDLAPMAAVAQAEPAHRVAA